MRVTRKADHLNDSGSTAGASASIAQRAKRGELPSRADPILHHHAFRPPGPTLLSLALATCEVPEYRDMHRVSTYVPRDGLRAAAREANRALDLLLPAISAVCWLLPAVLSPLQAPFCFTPSNSDVSRPTTPLPHKSRTSS